MSDFIPFSKPDITESEIELVTDVLRSGWLTTGAVTRRLEERICDYTGAEYAVALNSCTAGLHLALEAFGVSDGDVVITTPYTFAATGEVVRYLGATPLFVDIDPLTGNISPAAVEAAASCLSEGKEPASDCALAPGTRRQLASLLKRGARLAAIIPVHFAGLPCDMDPISRVASAHGVPVVEDAAHALESVYQGGKVGTLSEATAFSFYATKNLTTGEGGALTTDDGELAARVRMMSLHGISKDAWKRYTAEGSWRYEILEPGYKYNLTDIASALGLAQFDRIDDMRQRRLALKDHYLSALPGACEYLSLPAVESEGDVHAWHLFVVHVQPDSGISRNEVIEHLRDRGVGSSVHFIPLHLHPYYQSEYGFVEDDFPAAESFFDGAVSLPLYPTLGSEAVDRVVAALAELNGNV